MRSLNHNLAIVLLWMCHSRSNNGKINRLQERCLRIIYSDKQSSFETLLEKDGSVSVHNRNLQVLATEMYKIKKDLSPFIITEFFEQRNESNTTSLTLRPLKELSFHYPSNKNSVSSVGKNLIPAT